MNQKPPAPVPRLTMITLGVHNMRASIAFYEAPCRPNWRPSNSIATSTRSSSRS
jgi:hypothetical protein